MDFGRGDAILKYPELVRPYDDDARAVMAMLDVESGPPYVAVHLTASEEKKIPPERELLIAKLIEARVPFYLVGEESGNLPMNFRLHTEIVQHCRKFIGTLSVFNCVAQLARRESLVLVNRSVKEPRIYNLMNKNNAKIVEWNPIGKSVVFASMYDDVVAWAKS